MILDVISLPNMRIERYVIDDERDKTTDEAEVYDPQTDSWSRALLCPKEQITLPLLLIIVNRL